MTGNDSILHGARIYLSGPMDFLVSRDEEKQNGWRSRLRQFLKPFAATVYDPWSKPVIVGQNGYGKDYEYSSKKRAQWTFADNQSGCQIRSALCDLFYPTVQINRRMVDICDLLIAYCPTNVYSVGTVNEIIRARSQNKPVLFVSPPITYPALDELTKHLSKRNDRQALTLLEQVKEEAAIKENVNGVPSPWYLGILPEDYFFDGFGFHLYPQLKGDGNWPNTLLDEIEHKHPPKRPLLPYLEKLNSEIPKRYDPVHKDFVDNSDWLILKPGVHEAVD